MKMTPSRSVAITKLTCVSQSCAFVSARSTARSVGQLRLERDLVELLRAVRAALLGQLPDALAPHVLDQRDLVGRKLRILHAELVELGLFLRQGDIALLDHDVLDV